MNYPWLDKFLLSHKGTKKDFKVEWQWTRYLVGGKMFAAICKNNNGNDTIVTLKLDPLDGDFLRKQFEDINPGYYMNKKHWNSVNLDGDVPDEILKDMADKSYHLVFNGLSKKLQNEIKNSID
ncbi:MmcQ/YjbR family DNA-binding protein [Anaerosacchariphilus polymeriproducens]|uniref:MmcQ/YjbR family DNA-binding protein n=1 Tax=Anaerosacchariphilus polymeriproducens TaxID=1812858 RepID=A0A371ATY1_9FIRM|nr:MmcQ/YjbR family DNA-binding protein [Anaerosacchariphilus polymeriproducens]RDU23018.1 MmcQ/YjbR family DNA-binding protein [Anaerosacchariphilus polymeriproducens]